MWRYLAPISLFAALGAFLFIGLGRNKEILPSPLIGKSAPPFALPSVLDPAQTVASTDYAGQAHVLNVWATWCPGCHQEHEVLLEIAKRGEVPIIGIDWNDELALAQRWLSELGNPYVATAFDAEGRVAIDLGVYMAPQTFLVDANGLIVHKHFGPLSIQAWESDFLPLIRK